MIAEIVQGPVSRLLREAFGAKGLCQQKLYSTQVGRYLFFMTWILHEIGQKKIKMMSNDDLVRHGGCGKSKLSKSVEPVQISLKKLRGFRYGRRSV